MISEPQQQSSSLGPQNEAVRKIIEMHSQYKSEHEGCRGKLFDAVLVQKLRDCQQTIIKLN